MAYAGLDTFINDVTAVIATEELNAITLVGHSFGGMVITGVADRMPERIRRLVYLDAIVPDDGESLVSSAPGSDLAGHAKLIKALGSQAPDGEWMTCPPAEILGLHLATPDMRDWDLRNATEHPLSSFIEPLPLSRGRPQIPSTYIVCDDPPMPGTAFVAHHADVVAGIYGQQWIARRIATGHMAMVTAPSETVALLAEAALV